MNSFRLLLAASLSLAFAFSSTAAESTAPMSASDLAAKLRAQQPDGTALVRLRMEIKGAAKETLHLQIKERRTKGATEVVYQVLWPKERKGEAVLVKSTGSRATGSAFTPPNAVRALDDLKEPLLGSDLAYADVVEDFFAWNQQAIVGTEEVDGVNCQILESKPGKGERSIYGSVRSWIDTRRTVPLRVEKYSSAGKLVRRIDTTRVVTDAGRHIPANLTVQGPLGGSATDLDGSRIKHDVNFTDREFTVEGLKELATPRGAAD